MVKKPRLFIALCTLPALILTIVFMIVTMVNAIYLSFTSSTALSVGFNSKFVFLDNYRYMFQDKDFLQALFNTLKLMLVIPAVTIFLSLVFAFILTQGQLKEKSFYRTVFFFPSIVSMTVVGIVWSFVFNPTRGILNHMLDLFHLSTWKHAWLGEGITALLCIGAALGWQAIGYSWSCMWLPLMGFPRRFMKLLPLTVQQECRSSLRSPFRCFADQLERPIYFPCLVLST